MKGYAVNKALTEQRYMELKQLVAVLGRTVKAQETLTSDDALNLVEVVSDYAYALDTLDKYDYQQLAVEQTTNEAKFHATYEGAMQAIEELKAKFGGSQWFAHEKDKDDSFKSSIGQIYQTFGGQDLYPSVEEKAAMLLYLVTKNHSFNDCRNPYRGKGCDGKSGCKSDKTRTTMNRGEMKRLGGYICQVTVM